MMRAIYRAAARPLTAHELTEKLRVRGIKIRRGKLTPHGYEYILQFPTGLQKTFWSLEEAVKSATSDEAAAKPEETKAFREKIRIMKLAERGIRIEKIESTSRPGSKSQGWTHELSTVYQVSFPNGYKVQCPTLDDAFRVAEEKSVHRKYRPSTPEDRPRTAHIPSPVDVKLVTHRVRGMRGHVVNGFTITATMGNVRRIIHISGPYAKAEEIVQAFKRVKNVEEMNRVYGKYTEGKKP